MGERQWEIVRILSNVDIISITILSSRLGVSYRTVLRDIDVLTTIGYQIEKKVGVSGGVCLTVPVAHFKKLKSFQIEVLRKVSGGNTLRRNDIIVINGIIKEFS